MVRKRTLPEKCRCGYRLEHPLIAPRLHFSPIGWVLLCLGATPFPVRVDYVCCRCDMVLDSTKDRKVMRTF